jgi:polyhydroxybutyrate depolymerase
MAISTTMIRAVITALALLVLAACSDSSDPSAGTRTLSTCADTNTCMPNPPLEIGGERPATVHIPGNYDLNTPYPLIVVLHGFNANGALESGYLGLTQRVDEKQYVLVTPDGTLNAEGRRFWNATPACCADTEEERSVDDVAYIRGLITEAAATYNIDTSRIALHGHSNGGFMALRLACEASDLVTTVISLAGSTWENAETCSPATNPVSVMALHGTRDDTIGYNGRPGFYPSAPETAERFAVLAGCDPEPPTPLADVDMDGGIEGVETERLRYQNCNGGTTVELWTMQDGVHIPAPWTEQGFELMADWLIEHPR